MASLLSFFSALGSIFHPVLIMIPLFFFSLCIAGLLRGNYSRLAMVLALIASLTSTTAHIGGIGIFFARKAIDQAMTSQQEQENLDAIASALTSWLDEKQAPPAILLELVHDGWLPWDRLISPLNKEPAKPGRSDYGFSIVHKEKIVIRSLFSSKQSTVHLIPEKVTGNRVD